MIDKLNIVVPDVDKGILDVIFCNFCALKTGRWAEISSLKSLEKGLTVDMTTDEDLGYKLASTREYPSALTHSTRLVEKSIWENQTFADTKLNNTY